MTVKVFKPLTLLILGILAIPANPKVHAVIKNFGKNKKVIISTQENLAEPYRKLNEEKDTDEDIEEESVLEESQGGEEGMGKNPYFLFNLIISGLFIK